MSVCQALIQDTHNLSICTNLTDPSPIILVCTVIILLETKEVIVSDKITMRVAQYPDMDLIAEMIRSTAHWYESIVETKEYPKHFPDEAWKTRNFQLRDFYVAETPEGPVGAISLQYFDTYAYLGYCNLFEDACGEGNGEKMLAFAATLALLSQCDHLIMLCHPDADWAVKAIERFGFHQITNSKDEVLSFENGVMKPYYEEGFQLFQFNLQPLYHILHLHSRIN